VTAPSAGRLAHLRLVLIDVDGVLTDGRLWYGEGGEQLKAFDAKDGVGIRLLQQAGVALGVVTARQAPALKARLADLGIVLIATGREDKGAAALELCEKAGVAPADAAFVGDDVLDLPALRAVGLGVAVADAHPLFAAEAAWVTRASGGRGAIRELADAIVEAHGGLAAAVERYLAARSARPEGT
jgi:3-deoxy-D-manno-octulosonate 8-phosphate phosphatase (KDO 8-P phosphatase)